MDRYQWLLTANLDDIDPAMGHCKGMEIASWLTDNAGPDARSIHLMVRIQDSQSWHRGSIPLSTTKKHSKSSVNQ